MHRFANVLQRLSYWDWHNMLNTWHSQSLQEEDVIGVLPASEKVGQLKPLGDRILIKVWLWDKKRRAIMCAAARELC